MRINSLYASVSSTSDIAVDLISLAMNYDNFWDGEYIIFCNAWGSYYIVWGDLQLTSDNYVTAGDISFIHYYCANTTLGIYEYETGSDSTFSLNLSGGAFPTSSLEGVGFSSLVGSEYEYYKFGAQSQQDRYFDIFSLAIMLVIMFCVLRGTNK